MLVRPTGFFLAATALSVGVVGVLVLNLSAFHQSLSWEEHTNEVLRSIFRTEIGLLQAESGERGWLLSGDVDYRNSYERGAAMAEQSRRRLARLVEEDEAQLERLNALTPILDARLGVFSRVIELGPSHREEALAILATEKIRQLTNQAERKLEEMRQVEAELLAARQNDVKSAALRTDLTASAMALLALLSTTLGVFLWERNRSSKLLQAASDRTGQLQTELLHISRLSNMGEMASALAHELNQPLTALGLYLQAALHLLAKGDDPQWIGARQAVKNGTEQAQRAGQIIRRLREFVARGETEKKAESLESIVKDATALTMFAGKEKKVRLTFALDPSVDLVLVDRVQIQQILVNLIRNGLEAMKNSPRRELVVKSSSAGNGMVAITVADTGAGIAPEIAANLFDPFTTTKKSGLGIGLSISRTIAEAHGGKLEVSANPEGGTIFRLTLRSGILKDVGEEFQVPRN